MPRMAVAAAGTGRAPRKDPGPCPAGGRAAATAARQDAGLALRLSSRPARAVRPGRDLPRPQRRPAAYSLDFA